jgi:uncharacterized protein (DUF2267 family)
VDYAELLQQVQAAAALDRATAERVLWATTVTLVERLSRHDLAQLRLRLPEELQAALAAGSPTCRPFDADEFVDRVAERLEAQPQVVWTQVRGAGHARPGGGRARGAAAAAAARVRRTHGLT